MSEDVNLVQLVCRIRLESDVADPYLLYSIRSHFPLLFRQAVGCRQDNCANCAVFAECPWDRTFGQRISPDPDAVRRFQKPPLPFVFDIPLLPATQNRGAIVELGLTLVGSAIAHLPFYLKAVSGLCVATGIKRPILPVSILSVGCRDASGAIAPLPSPVPEVFPEGVTILTAAELAASRQLSPSSLVLEIDTPLRLMQEGRPARSLVFSQIARTLLRRVSAISYYYGDVESTLDYKWLSKSSEEIDTAEYALEWREWPGNNGGLVGSLAFTGDLSEFHSFLALGEVLHLGKGASYGMGRYRVLEGG